MKVINIKFRRSKKIYPFIVEDNDLILNKKDYVLVETIRGQQVGIVVNENLNYNLDDLGEDKLRKIIRKLDLEEIDSLKENDEKSNEAFFECKKIVKSILPEMNLVIGEYTHNYAKLIFYFTAENRLDFRELVKVVNKRFNRKVEFYQIKYNDENRILNVFGRYGKELFW